MEIKYFADTDELISVLKSVYPFGYVALALDRELEFIDILTENGYKVLTRQPYPEYVRCIICDEYNKSRNFNGKSLIIPKKIDTKLKLCDYVLIDTNKEKDLKSSLFIGFLWIFLTIEDINLRNYYSFEKYFYDEAEKAKNTLVYNDGMFSDKLNLYFELINLIEKNTAKNNILNFIEKTESLTDADKFFIYYYILSAYFVFTSKGKFVIMAVKGRHMPLTRLSTFKQTDYRDFKDVIENVKTSYDYEFLKTAALKYKKINGRKGLSVNSDLLKTTLNVLCGYASEGFYKELLENGYL